MKPPALTDHNLMAAERLLCESALRQTGSIVEAAKLLGVTRHALKRRIIRHGIRWDRDTGKLLPAKASPTPAVAPP